MLTEAQRNIFIGNTIGNNTSTAITENINPPIAPTAKANQNTSFCPDHTNGTNPNTVEIMVREIGIILWLNAFI